ncbi:phosphatase [Sulfurovum sp. zt1-1]|uniref:Phosphatase n=1 Tax=Sulfurovum zhangzhouensis TaxID=3019067 RepID=A0ABT7QWI5_9BACT|nr:phosphatase [Sulfurovum zhangzhouensis]MDM5271153.1 phosphatase [Sulfurovum zhangzhouensis]
MIAIDLGSNTLRVIQLDCEISQYIAEYEKIVKTADGLAATGIVSDAAVERIIAGLMEAKTKIDFEKHPLKAVTTEAIRKAKNAQAVLEKIKKETGVEFEIISGDEEARLTLLAVKHRLSQLHYASRNFVVVDIGGGSTELIFHYEDEVIARSFPIGIVTVAQTYETLENIQKELPDAMFGIEKFCAEVFATKGHISSLVATAGTPTSVAAMKLGQNYATYDASKINGTTLTAGELDFYLEKLLAMPLEKREETCGTGRSDLIAAGILIFKHLFKILECDKCIVVDDGLREGVALEGCKDF